ncbi:hypothetical protein BCR34DRAFT_603498 [Clohesyomyces aquaticus]|uniref:Uncharacterized protein n=1 Tax=Clohesyomyces aquaticus TaxID=1231657 RepID=A0A1Y1ZE47_9PLEO|nr:hypothetical protein BCR34DRAFT_603498 [Clohesyomyces aquaticus]
MPIFGAKRHAMNRRRRGASLKSTPATPDSATPNSKPGKQPQKPRPTDDSKEIPETSRPPSKGRNTPRLSWAQHIVASNNIHIPKRSEITPTRDSTVIQVEEEESKATNELPEDLEAALEELKRLSIANNSLKAQTEEARAEKMTLFGAIVGLQKFHTTTVELLLDPYRAEFGHSLGGVYHDTERLLKRIMKDVRQNHALKEKIQQLQQGMLGSRAKVVSVPDEAFAQQFRHLASAIKSVSRAMRFDTEEDLASIFESYPLIANVSKNHWNTRQRKKYLVEAAIWSVLIQHVFNDIFCIFGPTSLVLRTHGLSCLARVMIWAGLRRHHDASLGGMEQLKSFSRIGGEEVFYGNAESPDTDLELLKSVADAQVAALNALRLNLPEGIDYVVIHSIVANAFALALRMSLQHCRLQVVYPKIGEHFEFGETNHLTSIPAGEHIENGQVGFIVNPGLAKWGDSRGKLLGERLDLVPSLVYIEKGGESEGMETPSTT